MSSHLSNVINVDSSIWISHSDFSARMSPSDPVQGRVTIYCDTSSWNLRENTNTSSINLKKVEKV